MEAYSMQIDISKAQDGIFYGFSGEVIFDDALLAHLDAGFASPVKIEGKYVTDKGEVYVTSKAETELDVKCDRCLKPIKYELVFEVDETFALEDSPKVYEDEVMRYSSNVVDLDEAIKQSFFLALPIRILCKEDCKGLCPHCGRDLNEGACGCEQTDSEIAKDDESSSPFAVLKNINFNTGGASNGSTKG